MYKFLGEAKKMQIEQVKIIEDFDGILQNHIKIVEKL